MDRLTYILDISPTSGNKSMLVRLAVAVEDPRCVVVALASFWRLGGGACWWSMAILASMSIVCRGIFDP